ncbi:hypothetical protein L873DRAFT_307211 [Choiromyces venosus 120613-1]|uniref:Uncharacterized protein n=1 Tax=Choiromyces venosus 120613-1 TaxID=1336337 RepID=A0A3N4J4S9_9PEZI|nr:hypothetical protein L873DRAFT_307211 [Choiromyces venosus 120613-1]
MRWKQSYRCPHLYTDARSKLQAQEISPEVKLFFSAKGISSPTFWKASYKHQVIRESANPVFRTLSFSSLLSFLAGGEPCYKIISKDVVVIL